MRRSKANLNITKHGERKIGWNTNGIPINIQVCCCLWVSLCEWLRVNIQDLCETKPESSIVRNVSNVQYYAKPHRFNVKQWHWKKNVYKKIQPQCDIKRKDSKNEAKEMDKY